MSKNKTRETKIANSDGKTVEELKEIVKSLQTQMNQEQVLLTQDQTTIQNRQAKILKMQGALEVMLQMIPRQEVEEMIAQEARENHQEEEAVEG